MSDATRAAVCSAWAGDTALNALLPRHPSDASKPAILRGRHGKKAPVYPCVTYRFPNDQEDGRFRPTAAEGGGRSKMREEIVEAEAWATSAATAAAIAERMKDVLDGRVIAYNNTHGTGRIFDAKLTAEFGDGDDDDLHAYFVLLRFLLKVEGD